MSAFIGANSAEMFAEMESREGTPPSLDTLEGDIMIGMVKVKVSRSPASNPLRGPP